MLAEELGDLAAPPASIARAPCGTYGASSPRWPCRAGARSWSSTRPRRSAIRPRSRPSGSCSTSPPTARPTCPCCSSAATEVLLDLPPGLADRLAARCLAGPLTEAESSAYVLGRLAAARADAGPDLFSPAALTALHHAGRRTPPPPQPPGRSRAARRLRQRPPARRRARRSPSPPASSIMMGRRMRSGRNGWIADVCRFSRVNPRHQWHERWW